MYNTITRAQNTFGFFTTVAFFVAAIIALSDLVTPRAPSVGSLKTTNKEEYAIIKFSLDADLSDLFTWNTKQVFVYVTAEWPDNSKAAAGTNATNQAVIWDQIITSPSADHLANIGPAAMRKLKKSAEGKSIDPNRGKLRIKNQKPKYQITHPSSKIAEADKVVLKLHYNVQPWVGILTWNQNQNIGSWKALKGGVSKAFKLPALKVKENKDKKP
ncbi:microsomal signal peptidase subunit 3 [Colletotrichum spaethianum]|uniref:Signal peptidase subunit 3 n=1 Tax=Colletotrichum spaethianum TaxID=700344 RepID=A0AA37P4C8_9PEZI|nr:microsomal signal peptidase subunit 3 [Colletotrichum spaethianum]GKT40851.1 microsomal signal peptidase subunit 3 [Colletotrichum spaethianum]